MNSFTDYYAVLGVDASASADAIKAAFKKLALQYHPDVYKGEDAHERMSQLLLAYQTLNDPAARRQYDARRSEHIPGARVAYSTHMQTPRSHTGGRGHAAVSPGARRDRQRYYDFPDFRAGSPVHIDLIDMAYTLSPAEARTLLQQGMLRGVALETEEHAYYCHRCHHHWDTAPLRGQRESKSTPRFCPKCKAADWTEYLLLRCVHCCAVFESEQIRYEIGSYTYGKGHHADTTTLCPPYELFPLCPYCGTARWCPAEESRVHELREHAAQRAARQRLILISATILALVIVGFLALSLLR